MAELTQLQRDILKEKRTNPEADAGEIANAVGCSESHAYQTLENYDTAVLDSADVVESDTSTDNSSSGGGAVALLLLPFHLSLKLGIMAFKLSLWLALLPFRILFGNSSN